MHVQMLFVIIAFSEHHLKTVLHQIGRIPVIGESIQQPIRDLLHKQKMALHRAPGTHVEQVFSSFCRFLEYDIQVLTRYSRKTSINKS
ncbi:hypothetical protein ANCCAN_26388 [Ancylostoma caninum]|uniref:Uncharacterized protein n=1 Tax=Ancylostoma caninum TaxID=29170 RepID=A0A368FAL2_ANCCA|nr:hypothetical protein ANCCAN_26388 [Ancylostoma caninum]